MPSVARRGARARAGSSMALRRCSGFGSRHFFSLLLAISVRILSFAYSYHTTQFSQTVDQRFNLNRLVTGRRSGRKRIEEMWKIGLLHNSQMKMKSSMICK